MYSIYVCMNEQNNEGTRIGQGHRDGKDNIIGTRDRMGKDRDKDGKG